MSIRQILDWGLFIKKYSHEIDWDWFLEVLDEFHMKDFFSILNTICIEDLGFDLVIFPVLPIDSILKKRILDDTLSPEFNEPSPSTFIHRVIFKYRRWKANGWKHKLCYKESMISSFMSGVWGHFLKPSSI
jgi:hypothetical protein